MKKETTLRIIACIIALMFFYAAIIKLTDYERSKQEMMNQVFPLFIAGILTWAVPVAELILTPFLVISATRLKGMYAALGLLVAFSLYIVITMTGVFRRIPCSCGNIISEDTTYSEQLIFNLCFIVLTLTGLAIERGWKIPVKWFNPKRKELARN